ncbi:MAG TPA: TldD/PmbA family protein, partial [Thermodesulfobacteriota bacterium]|nr:TldD/PmbA family protein [Thermodesulfobacteriota bacterium]
MEQLLEQARRVSDQSEVFFQEQRADSVSFENGLLKNIESRDQSGISLRLIRDGHLGFAYTRNLHRPEELVQNALDTLPAGVEARYALPERFAPPAGRAYDPAIEDLSNTQMVEEGRRLAAYLGERTDGQVNLAVYRSVTRVRLINSRGSDLDWRTSNYGLHLSRMYPGSYNAVERSWVGKKFEPVPDDLPAFLLALYNRSRTKVHPSGGRMKCLLLPETLYTLVWRIQSATSGKNIFEDISPLKERIGEKIFADGLTLVDDPLESTRPNARGFDDEGSPCTRYPLIEKGVLRNYYYDLNYAEKLGVPPSGHGYRTAPWGGDAIATRPRPALEYLGLEPGRRTFAELLRSVDRGVLVAGALGAHSGNIPNGDFSFGLAPGIYVEGGEIVGILEEAMVAGNIYEVL